jgi:hypothetical protein
VINRYGGQTVTAVVTITARDAAGNASTVRAKRRIRLAAEAVLVTIDRGLDPAPIPRKVGCRGRVALRISDNRRALARATVRLTSSCRYRKRFKIARAKIGRARRLDLVARFLGNSALGKATYRFPNSITVPG